VVWYGEIVPEAGAVGIATAEVVARFS
jgi:hypothetical protein